MRRRAIFLGAIKKPSTFTHETNPKYFGLEHIGLEKIFRVCSSSDKKLISPGFKLDMSSGFTGDSDYTQDSIRQTDVNSTIRVRITCNLIAIPVSKELTAKTSLQSQPIGGESHLPNLIGHSTFNNTSETNMPTLSCSRTERAQFIPYLLLSNCMSIAPKISHFFSGIRISKLHFSVRHG